MHHIELSGSAFLPFAICTIWIISDVEDISISTKHMPLKSQEFFYIVFNFVWKHRSWINQFYSLSVFGKVFWLCSLYLFMEELKNLCHITTRNSRTCSVCKCSSASSLSSQTQPTQTELNENKIDIRLRILHGGRHLLLWRSNTQITTSPYAHRIKLHVK